MQGMEAGPGMYPEALGFFLSAWVVMMAAMMFPSVWPTVGLYARMQGGRREQGAAAPAGATGAVVGGYLLPLTPAGLAALPLLAGGPPLRPPGLGWGGRGGRGAPG